MEARNRETVKRSSFGFFNKVTIKVHEETSKTFCHDLIFNPHVPKFI